MPELNERIERKIKDGSYNEAVKSFILELIHWEVQNPNKNYSAEYDKNIQKYSTKYRAK